MIFDDQKTDPLISSLAFYKLSCERFFSPHSHIACIIMVLIHLDLDVQGPAELIFALGTDPDGMTLQAVGRVINDIAKTA
ncbi:hypothetical protein CBG46_07935 [Actinobacillus succinogenes]|nr:hypothetical protein CBG46_07935 [Actinobacillus succinogenes]